jgi:hypothetical protein
MMDTTEKLYKWLRSDRTTPVQGVKWPKRIGAWTAEETPVLCESGWHGVEAKDAMEYFQSGLVLWEVEVRGERVDGSNKFAVSSMRLVREIGSPTDKTLRLLACDIAEDVLHFYEERYPKDSRVRDCIEVARRYANGEATEQERDAAGVASYAAYAAASASASYASYAAYAASAYAYAYAASAASSASSAASAAYAAAAAYAAYAAYAAARKKYSQWLVDAIEAQS